VDDVSACLRAADLFVFPTMDEAFGLSLVEAMACGLPVVSTAVGGIRDFLAHGTNGMEVPAGDADALHRAISRLLADDLARQRLGCAARDTAVSRYSLQAVATAWVDLFETVSPRQHALQAHDG
jgi:glycosyltransferase involved in cell wall biosynthesis